jgi:uncharacterized membrane protein
VVVKRSIWGPHLLWRTALRHEGHRRPQADPTLRDCVVALVKVLRIAVVVVVVGVVVLVIEVVKVVAVVVVAVGFVAGAVVVVGFLGSMPAVSAQLWRMAS